MTEHNKDTQIITDGNDPQGEIDAKRELAKRMMEGNEMEKNKEKAVSLLEECVTLGDAEAMMMLAECCALGRGMKQNVERAKSLISDAAKRGNKDASNLFNYIEYWDDSQTYFKCFGSLLIDEEFMFVFTRLFSVNFFTMPTLRLIAMNLLPIKTFSIRC